VEVVALQLIVCVSDHPPVLGKCTFYTIRARVLATTAKKAEAHPGYVAPEARNKLGALIFEPRVFREQIHFIEEVIEILLGPFGAPQRLGARVIVPLLYPPQRTTEKREKNYLQALGQC